MAAAFGERQRAEQFAKLLDGLDGSRDGGSGVATLIPPQKGDPELTAMLRVVETVIDEGRLHAPTVRPEFREQLGARLHRDFLVLFNADVHGGPGDGDVLARGRTPWRRRLIGGSVSRSACCPGVSAAWRGRPPAHCPATRCTASSAAWRTCGSRSPDRTWSAASSTSGRPRPAWRRSTSCWARHDSNVDGSDTSKLVAETAGNLYKDVDSAGQLLAPLAEAGNTEALANLRDFLTAYEPQVQDLETLLAPDSQDEARRLVALMDSLRARVSAAQTNLDRQRAAQQHPGTPDTGSHRTQPAPRRPPARPRTPRPASTTRPGRRERRRSEHGGLRRALQRAVERAPVQVPIGSSDTTLTVPPLISGLPPIGITLGNTAPATGPTTTGAPNTDPNPN